MGRGPNNADWSNPEATHALVAFFHMDENRAKLGQGGNPTAAGLNDCAAYLEKNVAVEKGGPKTAKSIATRWKKIKSIYEAILAVIQKKYVGASGWNYDHENGFNVTDDNREKWSNFSSTHTIFKPFATKGWEFFEDVGEILPVTAKAKFVYNASSAVQQSSHSAVSQPSQTSTEPQSSQLADSQQVPDSGTPGVSQETDTDTGDLSTTPPSPPAPLPQTPAPAQHSVPTTSSSASAPRSLSAKRSASDSFDDLESPWGAKRGRITGPEAISSLSRSVESVGNAIRDSMPAPQQSSAMSLTKKIETACALVREDRSKYIISWDQSVELLIIFGQSSAAAGSYMSGQEDERGDIA